MSLQKKKPVGKATKTGASSRAASSASAATATAAVAAETIADVIRFLPQRYVERFPVAELEDFPGNPKDHDVGAITESIDASGWYGVVLVQEWPGTPRHMLAGHGRKKTLTAKGVTHVPALLIACDHATARKIVLADNRIPQLGGFNMPKLADFLVPLAQLDALAGTGYDVDDVTTMLRELNSSLSLDGNSATSAPSLGDVGYQVIVSVGGEHEQATLCEELEARGFKCRLLTL